MKNGALFLTQAYFTGGKMAEEQVDVWQTLLNKRYFFFRSMPLGLYVADDLTLTSEHERHSNHRTGRTIDKAVCLAYSTYV